MGPVVLEPALLARKPDGGVRRARPATQGPMPDAIADPATRLSWDF